MKCKVVKNSLGYAEVEVNGEVFAMHPPLVDVFLKSYEGNKAVHR